MKQGIYELSSTPKYPIGKRFTMDERVFRYAKVGGVATLSGRAAANLSTAQQEALAPATSLVGSLTVTITVTTLDLEENELAGGYLCYPGVAAAHTFCQHRIKSHPAATATNTCVLTLETPIYEEVTINVTRLIALHNPWAKVGYGNAYGNGVSFVGMPFKGIPVGQYTWLQTWGPYNICPGAYIGGATNERQIVFTLEGSLAVFAPLTWADNYQHAGFLLPCTYHTGGLHNLVHGGHQIMLQICP